MKRQCVNAALKRFSTLKHPMCLSTLLIASVMTSVSVNAGDGQIEQFFKQVDTENYKGNYSIIEQIGNNNSATVNQSYSASYQRGNFSKIYQFGDSNIASITQERGNNFGVIWQEGNDHEASINQAGYAQQLKAQVSQLGSKSDIQISQSGSGYRSINVEQRAYSGNARPVTVETY